MLLENRPINTFHPLIVIKIINSWVISFLTSSFEKLIVIKGIPADIKKPVSHIYQIFRFQAMKFLSIIRKNILNLGYLQIN